MYNYVAMPRLRNRSNLKIFLGDSKNKEIENKSTVNHSSKNENQISKNGIAC